jgi:uncharacterized alpha-E superfamily protein
VIDAQVTEAVLVAGESVIAHRRRNAAGLGPAVPFLAAVDLLLLDAGNPRSVRHALDRLSEDLAGLPPERISVAGAIAHLDAVDLDNVAGEERVLLVGLLEALSDRMLELSEAITRRYFVHKAPQRQLPFSFDLGSGP